MTHRRSGGETSSAALGLSAWAGHDRDGVIGHRGFRLGKEKVSSTGIGAQVDAPAMCWPLFSDSGRPPPSENPVRGVVLCACGSVTRRDISASPAQMTEHQIGLDELMLTRTMGLYRVVMRTVPHLVEHVL